MNDFLTQVNKGTTKDFCSDFNTDFNTEFCSTFFKSGKSGITYHTNEVFLETDEVTEDEKKFIRNCIYRQELLNLFDLEDFDEVLMNQRMSFLYKKIVFDSDFQIILEKLQDTYFLPSKEDCFTLLFSFDYLYMTHLCFCDLFESGKIEKEHKLSLLDSIQKNHNKEL
jgi:hypothetical protein